MLSAFGVDHGEVSKGVKLPRRAPKGVPTGHTGFLSNAQQRTAAQGTATRTNKTKTLLHRIGEADISLKGIGRAAGSGVRGTGRFMEKRPGLTGTALVGGGGAAGYKILSDKEPKRKGS